MYSLPGLEPVCCFVSSSNCCVLICIQISQEAGQVVWYSHLCKHFPQFVVIHSQRFWHSQWSRSRCLSGTLAFLMIQQMLAIWSLFPLPFIKPVWSSGSYRSMYCWSLSWRILSITLQRDYSVGKNKTCTKIILCSPWQINHEYHCTCCEIIRNKHITLPLVHRAPKTIAIWWH